MVNPFTSEVMPDQWCQGNRPPGFKEPVQPQRQEVKRMAYALWCKLGHHAFDPDDEGAEEFSRTTKKRDKDGHVMKDGYGNVLEETRTFNVCSEHLNTSFQPSAINGAETEA